MIVAAMLTFTTHGLLMPLLGYIGPDVFLPITSALAAVAGVLLMFWQKIVGFVGRLFGRAKPPSPPASKSTTDRH